MDTAEAKPLTPDNSSSKLNAYEARSVKEMSPSGSNPKKGLTLGP